jgi:TnpA family transposase
MVDLGEYKIIREWSLKDGDYEEVLNKASCSSLASNAILYWNTMKMSEIVSQLRKNGESISDESLSHISIVA